MSNSTMRIAGLFPVRPSRMIRSKLKEFTQEKIIEGGDQCHAFSDIVKYAIALNNEYGNSPMDFLDDLKFVLIGSTPIPRYGRSEGEYFAGHFRGAVGFKPEFRDRGNQVQHAMAGLYIPYKYGKVGHLFIKWREEEPQDDMLYDATYEIEQSIRLISFAKLPSFIRKRLCVPDAQVESAEKVNMNFRKQIGLD